MIERTLCLLALVGCLAWKPCTAQAQPAPEPPAESYSKGVVISLEGVILPRLERFVNRKLDQARDLGADLVILEINSPGGALEPTMNMATRLRDTQWAHTVAYVPDEALSGAAIIALACDEIVMQGQARLGDAGPVFQGPDALFRHAPEKIRTDLARRVRDLATANQRPPALAEAMVDMNLEVFQVTNTQTGQVTFMSPAEIVASGDQELWEKGPLVLESRAGSFLEVNGARAVELQLASAVVLDATELQQRYQLANPPIELRHNVVDSAVDVLNQPFITGLLFVVGAIALYIELSAPGIGVGGLVSGLCFTLFFWSRFLGGTAGWLEVILVLGGVAFLAVELFIIPGFGIAGITGLLLIIAGIVMAGQNHIIPQTPRAMSHFFNTLLVLLGSGMASVVGMAVLSRHFGKLPFLSRLVLRSPSTDPVTEPGKKQDPLPPVRRFQADVGDWGLAESPLRPAGKALFGDEYLDVVTDGSFVECGRQVRIIEISGNRIVVREIEDRQ